MVGMADERILVVIWKEEKRKKWQGSLVVGPPKNEKGKSLAWGRVLLQIITKENDKRIWLIKDCKKRKE